MDIDRYVKKKKAHFFVSHMTIAKTECILGVLVEYSENEFLRNFEYRIVVFPGVCPF